MGCMCSVSRFQIKKLRLGNAWDVFEACTYITLPSHSSGHFGPGPFSWGPPCTTCFAFWSRQMGRPEILLTSFLYTTFFTQTEPAVKMLASRLISDKLKCSGLPGTGWSTSVFSKIRGIKCTNKTQHIGSNLCEATKICGFCRKLFPRPNWEKKNANKFVKMFKELWHPKVRVNVQAKVTFWHMSMLVTAVANEHV